MKFLERNYFSSIRIKCRYYNAPPSIEPLNSPNLQFFGR